MRTWLSRYLPPVLLVVATTILFGYLQAVPGWLDPDSFYHVKMSQLILTNGGGALMTFPWLDQTTLATAFIDHHWFYHELLAAAIRLAGPLLGSIGLTIVLSSIFFIVWWRLLCQALPTISAWVVAGWVGAVFAVAEPLLFRLNLVKASALSLIFVWLIWLAVARRRGWWLAGLMALYVYSYGGWLMGLVVGGGALIVSALHDTISGHQWRRLFGRLWADRWLIAGLGGGTLFGLIINPYFPRNLDFYWQQVVQIGVVNYQGVVRVGMEWSPYGFENLFVGTVLVTIGLVAALAMVLFTARRQPVVVWQAFALTIFGAAITLRSQRYVEYYLPFAWTFIGLVALPYLTAARWRRGYAALLRLSWLRTVGVICLVVVWLNMAAVIVGRDWLKLATWFHDHYHPITELAGASHWIAANTVPGAVIFHSDWDEFPQLWYHHDRGRYIAGLDPTFLYLQSPEKYKLYEAATLGQRADIAVVAQEFGATVVVIKKTDHPAMLAAARQDPELILRYEDSEAAVFKIR